MKNFFLLLIFLFVQNVFADSTPAYLSPLPDSKYNKISTSVVLRYSEVSSSDFITSNKIHITGSKSGSHNFSVKSSDDNSTIIITPDTVFRTNETVTVSIEPKNVSIYSRRLSFSFETEKQDLKPDVLDILRRENAEVIVPDNKRTGVKTFANDTLPSDFPLITVTNSVNPSPGYIFLSDFSFGSGNATPFLMILDNSGSPVYYKRMSSTCLDFKKQPNGNLTYYSSADQKFYEMNERYQIVDSFKCGNGYTTDVHELRVLNNGHAFLMSYDPEIVNMRNVVPNGDSVATVIGLVVQELDASKNVVFQWRSWDHFSITDATHENFLGSRIDYVHGNAIELDNDGNLMISSRHMDEITKVNRSTGAIIWRLGGKNNQFTFLNDALGFSHQHCIRRIENGNITLFDNGNYRDTLHTAYSRAVEYELNENTRTINLVWEYKNSLGTYGSAMGNVQRLSNGNTIIGWGSTNPSVTEVDASGNKVFELTLPGSVCSYRAFRDDWTPVGITATDGNQIPVKFNLYQNYPNPFNPSTSIKFDIPKATFVKINFYNLIGQKVQEVNEGEMNAGSYEYIWSGGNFASGTYFYQIETSSFTETKRMILMK